MKKPKSLKNKVVDQDVSVKDNSPTLVTPKTNAKKPRKPKVKAAEPKDIVTPEVPAKTPEPTLYVIHDDPVLTKPEKTEKPSNWFFKSFVLITSALVILLVSYAAGYTTAFIDSLF